MSRLGHVAVASVMLLGIVACNASTVTPSTGSDNKEPQTIPLGSPPDEQIEQRIRALLRQVDGLGDVQVRVRDGVVHLDGVTETLSLEQRAVALARRVEQVVDVESEVEQSGGVRGRFAPFAKAFGNAARKTIAWLPNLGIAIVAFLPFLLLSSVLGRWRHPFHRLGVSRLTGSLIRVAVRFAVIIVGLMISLDILGIMAVVGTVVGTLGLLGLIGGLVFKDWVANYFPGVLLGMHPPFRAGDLLRVGEYEGRVLRITPRATVLMTLDGEELRIPNMSLLHETMINYSHHRRRRLRVRMFLAVNAPLQKAQDLARETLATLPAVEKDPPPFMRVRNLGLEAVEVEFLAWVDQDRENFRSVESQAKRAIHEAMLAGEVPLAEPALMIHLPEYEPREGVSLREQDADARHQAFLDAQMNELRSRSDERDFLAEGSNGAESPGARQP